MGGIAVPQLLDVVETTDMAALGPGLEAARWLPEAGRLALADRARHLGDPGFAFPPEEDLHPQEAVDLPNFGSRSGPTEFDAGMEAEGWASAVGA